MTRSALLLALTACAPGTDGTSDTDGVVDTAAEQPLPRIANLVPDDDPLAEGQALFLRGTYGTEILDDWPPAEFMLALMDDPAFGPQFERFGFLADPDDDFPLGFKRGDTDPSKVHETCGLCHMDELPSGQVWLGAPANRLDFTGFKVAVSEAWVAAGNPPLVSPEIAAKTALVGPGRTRVETDGFSQVVAARFPPYYDLDARNDLNYMGTGQNLRTEAFFSLFAFGAGAPNAATAKVPFPDEAAETLVAFMGSLRAPPPPVQDEALVAAGEAVFEAARCGDCHHADVADDFVVKLDDADDGRDRYPEDDPAWERGSIHTSGLHRVLIDGDPDGKYGDGPTSGDNRSDLIAFMASKQIISLPTDGYRPAILKGVWQRAPYLHNGSVPTLDDLLKPAAERPVSFEVHGFTIDTTRTENLNRGHEFGVDLSPDDKAALIAYVRSL